MEGREEAAQNALAVSGPAYASTDAGAQLALVQSALVVRKIAAKSDELLDFVRLQAPGTLLEEAALRRQVFVASQTDDIGKFQSLATDYLRRYRHSVYAGQLPAAPGFGSDANRFRKGNRRASTALWTMMSGAGAGSKARALSSGRPRLGRAGIDQVRSPDGRQSPGAGGGDKASAARAKLYHAASMITSPEGIKARSRICAASTGPFSRRAI